MSGFSPRLKWSTHFLEQEPFVSRVYGSARSVRRVSRSKRTALCTAHLLLTGWKARSFAEASRSRSSALLMPRSRTACTRNSLSDL